MESTLTDRFRENARNYKRICDSIIERYSKIDCEDQGLEVSLDSMDDLNDVSRQMTEAKRKLDELSAKNMTRKDGPARTGDSQLDLTYHNSDNEDTNTPSLCLADDLGSCSSDLSEMTVCSLNEFVSNRSVSELQPPDEELEMTFGEQTLLDHYPEMINRISNAMDRQNASEVADSVVRRYRRWRQQSRNSVLNKTFVKPRKGKALSKVGSMETGPRAKTQQQSPQNQRVSLKSQHRQPVLALDLSAQNDSIDPRDVSLHRTMTMSPVPQIDATSRSNVHSPSKYYFQPGKSSLNWSQNSESKSRSPSATSEKTCRPLVYADQHSFNDGSPVSRWLVNQSPRKFGVKNSFSKSPSAFSPRKERSAESFDRKSSWSWSRSCLSSPEKSAVPLREIDPKNPPLFFSPHLKPRTTKRPKFQRSLSFGSAPSPNTEPASAERIDMDFQKLYHRYACEMKYFNSGPPCSICTKGPQASRFQSALALSPRSLVWRKRHREQACDGHPQSKRARENVCTSSPGSKRYDREMLRPVRTFQAADAESSRGQMYPETSRRREPSNGNSTFLLHWSFT